MALDLATGIAAVSMLVAAMSLLVSYYAIRKSSQVAGGGFRVAESVKSDTAVLAATLQSIIYKAALYSQQDKSKRDDPKLPGFIDIKPEKASVQSFLNSPTALAFYMHADKKSAQGAEDGVEWRVFFLKAIAVLTAEDAWSAGSAAIDLERTLLSLSDADISEMANGLEKLPMVMTELRSFNQQDIIIRAMTEAMRSEIRPGDFDRFLKYLRGQGISDPDVDLFWGITTNDKALVKSAIAGGARADYTEGDLIKKYAAQWQKLKEAH